MILGDLSLDYCTGILGGDRRGIVRRLQCFLPEPRVPLFFLLLVLPSSPGLPIAVKMPVSGTLTLEK
eukprot:2168695-Amphidinium_carterae.1